MQITRAEAICQEFCSEVSASQVLSGTLEDLKETDEIRCELEMKFFPELCIRMLDLGYRCQQVQTDRKNNRCIAWFI